MLAAFRRLLRSKRGALLGAAIVSVAAIGALAAIAFAPASDEVGAGDVHVFERGADGPRSLGYYSVEDAISRASEAAGFAVAVPDALPDPDLQLSSVVIYRPAADIPPSRTQVTYLSGEEGASDKSLSITQFRPGMSNRGNERSGAEFVDLGPNRVRIETMSLKRDAGDTLEALSFTVVGREFDIIAVGIPRDAVLSVIDGMLQE